MSYYGQKNYNELQGIDAPGKTRYRIAQIGCFITAFSNVLKKMGAADISPIEVNAFLRDRGLYIDVDDGIRDDVGFGTISALKPNVVIRSSVNHGTNPTAGWPDSNVAIVGFYYRSQTTGKYTTHFCAVADAAAHTIIDSWDGVEKSAAGYGEPTCWATYADSTPAPIPPVSPVATSTPTADKILVVKDIPGYANSNNAANHISPATTVTAGIYSIFNQVHGMVNVTSKPGSPGSWINPADNVPDAIPVPVTPTAAEPIPEPTPEPEPAPEPQPEAKADFKDTYVAEPGRYILIKPMYIRDMASDPANPLLSASFGTKLNAAGYFMVGTDKYYRSVKSVNEGEWYGIPADAVKPLKDGVEVPKPVPVEEDDDGIFSEILDDIDFKKELEEFRHNLSFRETVVALVAKMLGFFTRLKFWKNKKG